jgi:hypothetical protein
MGVFLVCGRCSEVVAAQHYRAHTEDVHGLPGMIVDPGFARYEATEREAERIVNLVEGLKEATARAERSAAPSLQERFTDALQRRDRMYTVTLADDRRWAVKDSDGEVIDTFIEYEDANRRRYQLESIEEDTHLGKASGQ